MHLGTLAFKNLFVLVALVPDDVHLAAVAVKTSVDDQWPIRLEECYAGVFDFSDSIPAKRRRNCPGAQIDRGGPRSTDPRVDCGSY